MTARSGDHITSGTHAWGSCAAPSALSEESTGGWRRLGNDLRMQQRPQYGRLSRLFCSSRFTVDISRRAPARRQALETVTRDPQHLHA